MAWDSCQDKLPNIDMNLFCCVFVHKLNFYFLLRIPNLPVATTFHNHYSTESIDKNWEKYNFSSKLGKSINVFGELGKLSLFLLNWEKYHYLC